MALYLFICYYISSIDIKYYLIATEAILSFFFIAFFEFYFIAKTSDILLVISIPVTWFALLHLLNYIMPGKLGLADIHLIPVLCFAIGFPHSMYLPTVAAFIAIIYFFIRYRKEKWDSARMKKIPFGFFLSVAFVLLKLIPFSFISIP
jgi:Flp pilus assembly protein protease CpaA